MDSRILNMDTLEKELAELQVANREYRSPGQVKKAAPAVPPKRKKAQPQVPQSYNLQTTCEPSYSTRLQGSSDISNKVAPVYSNVVNTNQQSLNKDRLKYYNENSNSNRVYSNIPPYQSNIDGLPPPPPTNMRPLANLYDYNENVEDIPPPPSPVSSNYSELVRATGTNYHPMMAYPPPMYYHQGYANFEGSQDSSTYESIYEPINPRPNSNLSQQTSSTLYTPFSNGNPNRGRSPVAKEAEVDALTDLLVKSISDKKDADLYGICVKCHETIVGESSGCTAMNQAYHITCFACYECGRNLQGKPFYAVEGNPYCEEDYLNTLEKCSVCMNPILDRILRATGKPYHPSCFACVECGKSLDGVPFTVDATNQIHCIEDFHKKFAPRCCVCKLPIMPEPGQDETVRVVALDRSFHITCYKCEDCGLVLSSEAEGRGCYPLDDHILCKCCNARRVQMLTNVMTTDL